MFKPSYPSFCKGFSNAGNVCETMDFVSSEKNRKLYMLVYFFYASENTE